MAYNYGTPYYNYGGMYQPQPQPQMQPQPQVQRAQAFSEVLYATPDEARAYIIQPNQSVMLIDTQNSVFRIKTADNFGNSTTRTYKFAEINESEALAQKATPDTTKYVTVDEFNSCVAELKKQIKEMQI